MGSNPRRQSGHARPSIRIGGQAHAPARRHYQADKSAQLLSKHFGVQFLIDNPIPIGNPKKNHKFDLVSDNKKYVGE